MTMNENKNKDDEIFISNVINRLFYMHLSYKTRGKVKSETF